MALTLVLGYTQTNYCKTLTVIDETGEYSAGNLTGWCVNGGSGSNSVIDNGSIISASLQLVGPSGNTMSLDLMDTDIWRAITPYTTGDPFDVGTDPANLYFTITESLFGASLVDGIYTGRYTVVDSTTTTYKDFTVALYCNVECCVKALISRIPDYYNCEECNNQFIYDVVTMQGMLKALQLSAYLLSTTEFNNILTTLKSLCTLYGQCSNC